MGVGHGCEPVLSEQIVLPNEQATLQFAACLAQLVHANLLIFLQGDLGAGKTTLTRGLLRALGVTGRIKSPTYTLVESYALPPGAGSAAENDGQLRAQAAHHFDLYRFSDAREWLDAGFDELLNPSSLVLVEWPEKAAGCLPQPDLILMLCPEGEGRRVHVNAFTDAGITCLTRLTALTQAPSLTSTSTS